jgi:hypothetical protein
MDHPRHIDDRHHRDVDNRLDVPAGHHERRDDRGECDAPRRAALCDQIDGVEDGRREHGGRRMCEVQPDDHVRREREADRAGDAGDLARAAAAQIEKGERQRDEQLHRRLARDPVGRRNRQPEDARRGER